MDQRLYDTVQSNPIIAAVKHDAGLQHCLSREELRVVFVLYGDVCSIPSIVAAIHEAGKLAIVHADLITGLAQKEVAVNFLQQSAHADGIISTRQNMIQRAKELGLYTVYRLFIIDSIALSEAMQVRRLRPDFLDILPGVMPNIIRKIKRKTGWPLLAGGLITTKQDVMEALDAGAMAISTTDETVWDM